MGFSVVKLINLGLHSIPFLTPSPYKLRVKIEQNLYSNPILMYRTILIVTEQDITI